MTGIDAATGESRILRFGHPLQSVAALHGKLLVEINPGRTYEDRIDALEGKVARLIVPIYQLANDNRPDPAVARSNPFIFQAERATCAPLLGYPDAPPPRGQHLVPEAATAMPALSSDRRTYTFILRKTFRFSPPSNARLDAQTFRYSIERALSPKLGSDTPGIRVLGDLAGAQAFHAGRKAHISGIRVRGGRISFTLIRPSPDFLERLALPYFCPVPRDTPILPGGVEYFPPPGAGPYAFSGFIFNGEYAILRRNPNYGGSRPQRLDAIGFREGIDTAKAVAHIQRGSWDAVEHFDPLLAPGGVVARRFGGVGGQGISYRSFPRPLTFYLAFDARRPPFSDRRLRQAVTLALDRRTLSAYWNQALPDVAQMGPGALQRAPTGMEPTARIIPPGVRGGGAARFRPSDLDRARRLAGRSECYGSNGCPGRRRAKSCVRGPRSRRARPARHRGAAGRCRRRLCVVTRPEGRNPTRSARDAARLSRPCVVPDADARPRRPSRLAATVRPRADRPARPPARAGARPRRRSPRLASGHTRGTGRRVRDAHHRSPAGKSPRLPDLERRRRRLGSCGALPRKALRPGVSNSATKPSTSTSDDLSLTGVVETENVEARNPAV